ncbi:hypothetical protein ACA910_014008 [Epithemia clementina (nom. ined.)]
MSFSLLLALAAAAFPLAHGGELEDMGLSPQTDVSNELMLAYDIDAMRTARTDFARKKDIYINRSEKNTGGLSLQGLSLDAKTKYINYPLFNIYMEGFEMLGDWVEGDSPGNFDGKPVSEYANTVVNDLFLLNVTNIEAEAALAFNIAMAYYGYLYDALTACETNDKTAVIQGLDKAAALWIGGGQVRGDPDTGFMFYAAAQYVAGTRFNQIDTTDGSQVIVNSNVLAQFLLLRGDVDGDQCATTDGYILFRNKIRNLVFYLNQVLVQMMLHKIMTFTPGEPTDFVEMYALALLPQIASCDDDLFHQLVQLTIANNVDDSTKDDLVSVLQSSYSCLGLTCDQVGTYVTNVIPECDLSTNTTMAGYQPSVDVRAEARIDRDIRQINWFMRFGAVKAAKEYYTYGWNTFFSLRELALGETTATVSEIYSDAATYLGSGPDDRSFADNLLNAAFDKTGDFTAAELQAYVDGLLKGLVMFLGVANELDAAVDLVESPSGDLTEAQRAWDNAAALYIGATEGENLGGDKSNPGESIYGLARSLCHDFYLCDTDDFDAPINKDLIMDLTEGADALKTSDGSAIVELYNEILAKLIVPVIQGMLKGMVEAGYDPSGPDIGSAYSYSRMVLSYFNGDNPTEVNTMRPSVDSTTPTADDVDKVFAQMDAILVDSDVDCADVNVILGSDDAERDVCAGVSIPVPERAPVTPSPNYVDEPTPAPVPVTRPPATVKKLPPTSDALGWGRFDFTNQTVADRDKAVALDVKAMWLTQDVDAANSIYTNGTNFRTGLEDMASVTTLAAMSTTSKDTMQYDAVYNFYRYALNDDADFDNPLDQTWNFAHRVVGLALDPDQGDSSILGAELTVVMHSFFIILRQLNQAARNCKSANKDAALKLLDSAVAIWIGDEQVNSEFNSGYMMYAIAQLASEHFGMGQGAAKFEAMVNTELMTHFNTAKNILQQCDSQPTASFADMREEIKDITRLLTVPMVQELLYYTSVDDQNFAEMYGVAFWPQVAACNAGDYDAYSDVFYDYKYNGMTLGDQTDVLEALTSGLHCLGITCEYIGSAEDSDHENLKSMVSDICDGLNFLYSSKFLAGYKTEDANPLPPEARLDLDIHQIDILMRTGAVRTAQEIYEMGYNSADSNGLRSLKSLAGEITSQSASPLAALYSTYFPDPNFPDVYVMNIFNGESYQSASRSQAAALVKRMLQVSLVYLGVHAQIEKAQQACEADQQGEAFIDIAAALYIGSIEGPRSSGSLTNGGVMLMGLGKEVCGAFDNCESTGDSSANEFVLFAFADMKQWIATKDCNSSMDIRYETLVPMLAVSIIQAVLKFAQESVSLPASSTNETLASVDVAAKAILPQISPLNQTSATTIANSTNFEPGQKSITGGLEPVVDAFTYVVRGLNVKCDAVGTLVQTGLSICGGEDVAPPPDTSTPLGQDTIIYKSTTFVDNYANIALDIKQMEDDLKLNRKDLAELIYKEGQNSAIYDKFGVKVDDRSVASFSTNASATMMVNPLFQTAVYSLKDASGNYLGKPATQYADSIVQEFLSKADPSTLPAEAAVALNLWMEVANRLYESIDNCKDQKIANDDGIHAMDIVAAYWIGDGETAGDIEKGHLLYNLAEKMAAKFGTVGESGLANANLNFLRLLNQARLELSFPESCAADLATARKLVRAVNRILGQMIVIQVQGLIDAIVSNDADRVRIYAHGFVPLTKPCNPHIFEYLNARLIVGTYDEREKNEVVGEIYKMIRCFEITCDDVGQLPESSVECLDPPFQASLAGYRPNSDVADYAALDLDISLIDILMAQGAYEAAQDVYVFGKHLSAVGSTGSTTAPSLEGLSKSTRRSSVPDFNSFVQYYSSDNFYANTMITAGLNSADLPVERRRMMVVLGLQYLLMYMTVLEQFYESLRECNGDRTAAAQALWNRAAAYLIGSMEGQANEAVDRKGGYFLWGISKHNCADWGTCRNIISGSTVANERLLSLLYTGRGAVFAKSCKALEKAVGEIAPILRSIIVQATLDDLVALHRETDEDKKNLYHARIYVGAQALLPLINEKDRETANMISRNLDYDGVVLEDGFTVVAKGFTDSLAHMGIDCALVGGNSAVDFCTGEVESDPNIFLIVGIVGGVLLCVCILVLACIYCRFRKRRKLQEQQKQQQQENGSVEQPQFVRNTKGVLDEADTEYVPSISILDRAHSSADDMESDKDASDAATEDFMEVQIPEPV